LAVQRSFGGRSSSGQRPGAQDLYTTEFVHGLLATAISASWAQHSTCQLRSRKKPKVQDRGANEEGLVSAGPAPQVQPSEARTYLKVSKMALDLAARNHGTFIEPGSHDSASFIPHLLFDHVRESGQLPFEVSPSESARTAS
jgi:hypothetical protein